MIHCHRCQAINPPEQRHCQQCHRELLPGVGAIERIGVLIGAGLITAIGIWILIQVAEGTNLPQLGNCALSSPVFWGIVVIFAPISGLVYAIRPTPAFQKYLNRAKRHIKLDKEQAIADFGQAIELAPEKERGKILVQRSQLMQTMGLLQQATRDRIEAINSKGTHEGAEGFASLIGADRDVYVEGIRNSEKQALIKSHAAIAFGFCPKCRSAVQLDGNMHCVQHSRARISDVRLSVPEDAAKTQASIMESHRKKARRLTYKRVVYVIALLFSCIAVPMLLDIGPFADPPDSRPTSVVQDVPVNAFPAETIVNPGQAEMEPIEYLLFDEFGFQFEYPGEWNLIGKQDYPSLYNDSLKGLDQASVAYLGGAYIGGLNNCSSCAQVVILVINAPSIQGEFTEEQFQTAKENAQETMGERLFSYDFVTIDGLPASSSTHIGKSGETQIWEFIIVPHEPGFVFLVSMSSQKDNFRQYDLIFQNIADTLQIEAELFGTNP